MQSKSVGEAPGFHFLKSRALRFAEKNPALPQAHVVHVALFGGYVEISAKQYRLRDPVMLIKKLTQATQPLELMVIFFRPDHLTIGNVDIHDLYSISRGRHQSRRSVCGVAWIAGM